MNARWMSKVILVATLIVCIAVLAKAKVQARPAIGPLTDAPTEEIKQAVLRYTHNRFQVLSDQVTILLVRPVKAAELSALGLPDMAFPPEQEPPLMLVVIKGDFDVQNLSRAGFISEPFLVGYIAYVLDLRAGGPIITSVSRDGSRFKKLLNDPSLPDPVVPTIDPARGPEAGVAAQAPLLPAKHMPYGVPEPTIVPPAEH